MTARSSRQISTRLDDLDRRLLDVLVGQMLRQTGGSKSLMHLVLGRAGWLDGQWSSVAHEISTLTQVVDANKKPDWLKTILRWERYAQDPARLILEMKKHLVVRFQSEAPMDLCEAYALLLIDEISGVLDAHSITKVVQSPTEFQSAGLVQTESANEQSLNQRMGLRS